MIHVPLRERFTHQIRARAETYLRMAETARTPEAKRGLEFVAARVTEIAARREAEDRDHWRERCPAVPADPSEVSVRQ
jgi:hypothetical protein